MSQSATTRRDVERTILLRTKTTQTNTFPQQEQKVRDGRCRQDARQLANVYMHSEEPENWEERKDSRHRMFTYVLGNPRLGKKATQSLRVLSCSVSVFLLCRLCCSRFLPQSRVLQHTYVNIVWAPLAFFRSLGLLSIYVNILCAAQAFFRSLGFFSMYVNIVCVLFLISFAVSGS